MGRVLKTEVLRNMIDELGACSLSWRGNSPDGAQYYDKSFGYCGNQWMTKGWVRNGAYSLSWAGFSERRRWQ